MDKKLKLFYRVAKLFIIICLAAFILVKLAIWPFALKNNLQDRYFAIQALKGDASTVKYTTKFIQQLFSKVDYLLTPTLTMLFAVLAVKLVNTPDLFKEHE